MPTNEEGEFELVLGNRQLLSVFFIVVVLLGLFFIMGYILGRNTGPKAEVASSRPARPIEVPAGGGGSAPAVDLTKPPASSEPVKPVKPEPEKTEPAKPEPKPEPVKTEPVKPEPKPEPKKEAKAEPKKEAKAEPKKEVKAEPKPEPKKETPKAEPAKGGKGSYLQVSATTKKDAEGVIAKLSGKGFTAITTPVPNSDLVRVLVGPLDDVADARTKLKAIGYADPILRKM